MATVQALAEQGTFIIDHTEFNRTGDKVSVNGHFYSDKTPLLSVAAAGSTQSCTTSSASRSIRFDPRRLMKAHKVSSGIIVAVYAVVPATDLTPYVRSPDQWRWARYATLQWDRALPVLGALALTGTRLC